MGEIDEKIVSRFYDEYCEDIRMTRDQAHRIEFYSTMKYIERYLKPGSKVIEIGCGTGVYSLYIASQGYETMAIDISERNLDILKSKITKEMLIQVAKMNAKNLSTIEDKMYDVTLLLGPLYHLLSEQDIEAAINEAKRITKVGGYIFISFLSRDYILMRNCEGIFNNVDGDLYEIITNYNEPNGVFMYRTIPEVEELMNKYRLDKLHLVSTDGVAQFIGDQINNLTEEGYKHFLNYHMDNCERYELLGYSPHILYISKKTV
jgi:ubiquinone/menaquinone biosynthesis C-methylase UbiE